MDALKKKVLCQQQTEEALLFACDTAYVETTEFR